MTSQLFSPLALKPGVTLANRFVMPAMQRGYCIDGAPTSELSAYYRRRVEGGVAMVIGESCAIDHPSATAQPTAARLDRGTLPAWRACVDAVRGAGGHMLIQLWHEGALRIADDDWTLSPSGLAHATRRNGRAATLDELRSIRDAYVAAARDAADIGATGVEVHAAHGYFLDQCLWAETNLRSDGYGGEDIRARGRLAAEIIAGIRATCGADFLISLRLSQWKEVDFAAKIAPDPASLAALLDLLKSAGVDLIHASTRRFWLPEWPDDPRGLAGWVRTLSGLRVITVGSVGLDTDVMTSLRDGAESRLRVAESIAALDSRLAAGEIDLVAVGRSLIADPDWVNKVREDRFQDIRPFRKTDLGQLSWNSDIVDDALGA